MRVMSEGVGDGGGGWRVMSEEVGVIGVVA